MSSSMSAATAWARTKASTIMVNHGGKLSIALKSGDEETFEQALDEIMSSIMKSLLVAYVAGAGNQDPADLDPDN